MTTSVRALETAVYNSTALSKQGWGLNLGQSLFAQLLPSTITILSTYYQPTSPQSGFVNADYTQLVNALAVETDSTKQRALYTQLNDILLAHSFLMPIWPIVPGVLTSSKVQGVTFFRREGIDCAPPGSPRTWPVADSYTGSEFEPVGGRVRWSQLTHQRAVRAEHAELVAFWIGKHDPGRFRALPHVDAPRAECDDSLDLCITVVRVQIDVQPVLQGLVFGDGDEAKARIAVLVRAHDHLVIGLIQDPLVENGGPETGNRSRIACVDDQLVETDGHWTMLTDTACTDLHTCAFESARCALTSQPVEGQGLSRGTFWPVDRRRPPR
jgi:hypothetical protein